MDPDACLQTIEDALLSGEDYTEYEHALRDWLSKGGYSPNWDACPNAAVVLAA